MLLPDQPSDELERGAALPRASTPRRRSRRSGGAMVVVTAGLFVIVTLTVVWLWSSIEPACDGAEVAAITPLCDGTRGQP